MEVFWVNGYPKSLVSGVLHKPLRQPPPHDPTDDKETKLLFLPYVKGVSERCLCFECTFYLCKTVLTLAHKSTQDKWDLSDSYEDAVLQRKCCFE